MTIKRILPILLLGIMLSSFFSSITLSVQNGVELDGNRVYATSHEPEPEDPPGVDPSCESVIFGIGWILCPTAEFLLNALESVVRDGVVRSVLNFDAVDTGSGQREALEAIWAGFRSIANVGFVIAFFMVVYSAASGGLISAYDVKKLLPKLVMGAIMVQLSFFISVQLIVIFNALGESVVDLMLSPLGGEAGAGTGAVFNNEFIEWNILSSGINQGEEAVSALLLILIIIATLFSIGGVLLMVVVFILRNMALMVLTVISPLAFVAWILPNTEGLYRKWWQFYIQLLALFPIAMAFLASGRLVGTVWAEGGTTFGNQWIALIALFTPYIIAPKLFSLAGSAVGQVVRAAEGARDGAKRYGSKARGSQLGQRAEAGAKSRAAGAINRRYGEGRDPRYDTGTARNRVATRLARTGYAQRKSAAWQESRRKIVDQDRDAAKTNVDANRSTARQGYNGQTGDAAEVAYLSELLRDGSRATEAEQEAAVAALLNVHSNRGDATKAVSDFVKRMDDRSQGRDTIERDANGHEVRRIPHGNLSDKQRSDAGALRGRLIEQNRGSLAAVPQLAKPNGRGTVDGMDARDLHGLKTGSVEHFAAESAEAAAEIAARSVRDIESGGPAGQLVRDANVQRLVETSVTQMQNALREAEQAMQQGDTQRAQALRQEARQYQEVVNTTSRAFDVREQTNDTGQVTGYTFHGRRAPEGQRPIVPDPNDPNARVDSSDLPRPPER